MTAAHEAIADTWIEWEVAADDAKGKPQPARRILVVSTTLDLGRSDGTNSGAMDDLVRAAIAASGLPEPVHVRLVPTQRYR